MPHGACFLVLLLIFDLFVFTPANPLDAYDNDINKCLFTAWASGTNAVLAGNVVCGGSKLCYGYSGTSPAQFAVCYSTTTLIPEYTGHVVVPNIGGGGRKNWHNEGGSNVPAPSPQSSVDDYKTSLQSGLYNNFDSSKDQFCSRGHLTPCAAFTKDDDRETTMVNTNIAPQWQLFNSGNWAALEKSVRDYATSVSRDIYVITGTGGEAIGLSGKVIKLNLKVVAPKYYWKAICDPHSSVKKSVVFVAENPIGNIDTIKQSGGCKNQQTPKIGIVKCLSLDDFADTSKEYYKAGIRVPKFSSSNCDPKTKGTFMDSKLNFK